MMYGDPTSIGKLKWLTIGTAAIPQWRYILAMVLAFPGIVLYGSALFAAQDYITDEKKKKVYHYLNALIGTEKEYKNLTVKEFTKAAEIYETDHAGIYEMCKDDYPYISSELEKEEYHNLLD